MKQLPSQWFVEMDREAGPAAERPVAPYLNGPALFGPADRYEIFVEGAAVDLYRSDFGRPDGLPDVPAQLFSPVLSGDI